MSIPVMVSLGASAGAFFSVMKAAEASMLGLAERGRVTEASMASLSTKMSVGVVGAFAVLGVESIHLAANFETAMTHLVTAADLPKEHVKDLGDQFIALSAQVGVSAKDLADNSYYVLSEGFAWNQTSEIMHAAAELSVGDQADLTATTRALATSMHDYGAQSSEATAYADMFREALAKSGTTMDGLVTNMGRVDQVAHAMGIGVEQTLGALATLTKEGMGGAQAGTLLASAMQHLEQSTKQADGTLKGLGLNVNDFRLKIASKDGLTEGLTMLQNALDSHVGADGLVYLNDSVKSANGNVEKLAAALDHAPVKISTYIDAMAKASGGTKNLAVLLGLMGPNLQTFKDNTAAVGQYANATSGDLTGWSKVTDTLNFKTKDMNVKLQDMALKLGQHLLPAVSDVVGAIGKFIDLLDRNKVAMDIFIGALGILAGAATINATASLLGMVGAAGKLVIAFGATAVGAVGDLLSGLAALTVYIVTVAIPAVFAFIASWAGMAWDSIASGVGFVANAIRYSMVPALYEAATATYAWTVALLTNPITWIILLIVGLVVAIVLMVQHFNKLKDSVNGMGGAITYVIGVIVSILPGMQQLGMALQWLGDHWDEMKKKALKAFGEIVAGVARIVPEIEGHLLSMMGSAIATVESFVGGFFNAGYNIIMGLIGGIKSAIGAAISAVTSAMSSIYHAALGALGIHSPSKLFQEGVGVPIVQGIAAGIASSKHLISNQLDIATSPSGANTTGLGRLAYGGSNAGGQNVTFNLTVQGNIYGSNLQTAAREIWRELLVIQRQTPLGFAS